MDNIGFWFDYWLEKNFTFLSVFYDIKILKFVTPTLKQGKLSGLHL